jgi:hypothetical protein
MHSAEGHVHRLEHDRSPAVGAIGIFTGRFRFYRQLAGCPDAGPGYGFHVNRCDADRRNQVGRGLRHQPFSLGVALHPVGSAAISKTS